jgi:DNA-binding beta-propeller fold protein YncE
MRIFVAQMSRLVLLLSLLSTAACGVDVIGDDPPLDQVYDPVGLTLSPSRESLYVVNSNFGVVYRQDRGGTVVRIDTTTLDIVKASTAQIGTFGGQIELNADGNTAYIAVRGDKTLTVLDIDDDGDLSCRGNQVSTSPCRIPILGDDPYSVAVQSAPGARMDLIAVGHLLGGSVTVVSVDGGEVATAQSVPARLGAGATDIAISPRNSNFYSTSRFDNEVVGFRPVTNPESGHVEAIVETAGINIIRAAPFSGFDSRGLAFSTDGEEIYVANRGPDSLVVLDVGPTDVERGTGSRDRMVDQVTMSSEPSAVAVAYVGGRHLVYVSSYEDERILVIDAELRAVVDRIDVDGRPYEMAVDDEVHNRIYVTIFEAGEIAVIDINPESPSFHAQTGVIR